MQATQPFTKTTHQNSLKALSHQKNGHNGAAHKKNRVCTKFPRRNTVFKEKLETRFLNRYDAIYRRIDQQFDIPNSILLRLVMFCLDQNGKLSLNRRKQYQYQVPDTAFDALEAAWREVLDSA